VADLATLLKSLTAPDVSFTTLPPDGNRRGIYSLILDEDVFFKGYEYLETAQMIPPMYTNDPHSVVSILETR